MAQALGGSHRVPQGVVAHAAGRAGDTAVERKVLEEVAVRVGAGGLRDRPPRSLRQTAMKVPSESRSTRQACRPAPQIMLTPRCFD